MEGTRSRTHFKTVAEYAQSPDLSAETYFHLYINGCTREKKNLKITSGQFYYPLTSDTQQILCWCREMCCRCFDNIPKLIQSLPRWETGWFFLSIYSFVAEHPAESCGSRKCPPSCYKINANLNSYVTTEIHYYLYCMSLIWLSISFASKIFPLWS